MSTVPKVQNVSLPKARAADSVVPAWKLVLKRELTDLWIGGKAFNLLLVYSALLGLISYTYSFIPELNLVPAPEAVYEMLKNATAFSIFMGLIIGADSISGERDRSTLESLLITPVNRRHIVLAKLLSGISLWPATYLVALPFLYVIAQGSDVLGPAMFWGAITGTLLMVGYTGLGMLVSFWSSTNKISHFISLSIYALLLVPVELSGDGVDITGEFLQWINPVSSINYFLSKHLVYHRSVSVYWPWLISSIVLAVVTISLLLKLSGSRLRLEPGLRRKIRAFWMRIIGISTLLGLAAVSLSVSPANAVNAEPAQVDVIEMTIDSKFKQVKMGDTVEFNTAITNTGLHTSSPLIASLNVVNLDEMGDVAELEEWSPERTQYIDSLAPDEKINLSWIVNTGLQGDYLVYVVLIPQPANTDMATHPIASSSLQLMVTPSARLKPEGVLPFALGVPFVLLAITLVVYRRRRQQIDVGDLS